MLFACFLVFIRIDGAFGDGGEGGIGAFFFGEGFFEDIGGGFMAEVPGPGGEGAVDGDFIMLDFLGGEDEFGIAAGMQDFHAFFDKALHAFAGMAFGRRFKEVKEVF